MDRIDVDKIAELARLEFSEDEKDRISSQLVKILDYIDNLNEVNTDTTSEMVYPGETPQKLNPEDDKLDEFPCIENLTSIAPDFGEGHFRVKKVID
ncbi:Asp-tRNA(Asn)/Glu-tRNA(Gln) amidotransferase subunit GatC [Elusimicrobiota bacterium]